MIVHYLVEGESEAALLEAWLPRALPQHTHRVYPHEGKGRLPGKLDATPDPEHRQLLAQLPAKLRAYGESLNPNTDRVLVLVDADDDDCLALKKRLTAALRKCKPQPHTMIRIAVEETEAFYLGDPKAIRAAFRTFDQKEFRAYNQDSICGTWEVFQRVIKSPYEAKVRWGKKMGEHLSLATKGKQLNRSPSFVEFYRAVRALCGEPWP
ncbi:MAG: DUF4276 family protein [Myxococcales bacterium]|nr:DUF4276 family protein [Myxococcales bacterium]